VRVGESYTRKHRGDCDDSQSINRVPLVESILPVQERGSLIVSAIKNKRGEVLGKAVEPRTVAYSALRAGGGVTLLIV
jgi:hypothetical protein